MSFEVSQLKMEVVFVAMFSLLEVTLAEWVQVSPTPLRKVSTTPPAVSHGKSDARGNDTSGTFTVPNGFDYSEEFSCQIHNLTMMSYSKSGDHFPRDDDTNYLGKLETKLQNQIEERIRSLGSGRKSRTYHIGFPSLEGALVSISLLLFAVYLIKLVMKLVHTFSFKRGTTEYVGFLSNIRQPIVIGPNRQKRSFELDMDAMRLKALLEEKDILFK